MGEKKKGMIPALSEMTAQWEGRREINWKVKIQLYIERL